MFADVRIMLSQLSDRVRGLDPFTPSFVVEPEELYNPLTFVEQRKVHRTQTRFLVDRNILSPCLGVVRDGLVNERARNAAAIFAFALFADAKIEPNIALYEGAQLDGQSAAERELLMFRAAEALDPFLWAEIALTDRDADHEALATRLHSGSHSVDFQHRLTDWRHNYIVLLKLAELVLRGGQPVRQVCDLLEWLHSSYKMVGTAFALAMCYLAPHVEKKRLLKKLKSPNRDLAIRGIRNAAWDLTLVSTFRRSVERQEADGVLTVLSSFDRSVHRVARMITDGSSTAHTHPRSAEDVLRDVWGKELADPLIQQLRGFWIDAANPSRVYHRQPVENYSEKLIAAGEEFVRGWRPPSRGRAR